MNVTLIKNVILSV